MDQNQWDTYAQIFDEGVGEGGDKLHTDLIHPMLFSFIGKLDNKTILDAGCGNGYLAKLLAQKASHVTGIDSSEELLKRAKKRAQNLTNVNFRKTNLTQPLTFAHAEYDIVIANMVLQYVPNLSVFAKKAARILKPQGILIVIIDHPAHALFLRAQELVGKKNEKFLTSGSYFKSEKRTKKSLWDKAILEYYHRPIQDYINPFTPFLHLDKIEEQTDDGEMPRILGIKWTKLFKGGNYGRRI